MSFKKTKVVMLPTNEKANLKLGQNGLLVNNTLDYDTHFTNQHLYFLSDEEIKVGDWCIMLDSFGNVFSNPQQYTNTETQHLNKGLKKIIATTDTSLKIGGIWNDLSKTVEEFVNSKQLRSPDAQFNLPQPSKSFIEKYVREHYSGVPIKNVLVEYNHLVSTNGAETETKEWLKVASDNTITIRKIKDSWTTQEVVNLLQQFNNDKPGIFDCGKWMEENINL